jgi:hypothetical protein
MAAALVLATSCSPSYRPPAPDATKDAAYFEKLFTASWALADRVPAGAVEGTVDFLLAEYVGAFGQTSYDRASGVVSFARGEDVACVQVYGPEGSERDAWTEPTPCP